MAARACVIAIGLACYGALAATALGAASELPPQISRLLEADAECIDRDAKHLIDFRKVAQLTENHTLYLVPCFTGAYNVIYRVYVLDTRYPDDVKPSAFAAYADDLGWYGQIQLINVEFDTKTKTLTAFEKGRGLGDCGSIPTYKWHEFEWRMMEYRHWGKCDGSRMPDTWPVIYRYKPR